VPHLFGEGMRNTRLFFGLLCNLDGRGRWEGEGRKGQGREDMPDTFDLPRGAVRVYSSEKYENQAFVYDRAVGLQFHIEVDKNMVRQWTDIYRQELEREGLNPDDLLECEGAGNFGLANDLIVNLMKP